MKGLLSILFFFICISVFGTKYYVKIGGNNSLSGLSIANAWATVAKVNSFTFAVGDTVAFESGSSFIGPLIPNRNGVAGRPMVFTSYGVGQATITGFATLTGWSNLGSNIWESGVTTLKNTVNILTINDVPQRIGRTPNSTFYTYQSGSSSQLTSTSLSSAINYTGAEVVMRCNAFVMQRATITSQSGSTINYTRTSVGIDNNNPKGLQSGTANYGFFIQRDVRTLDQAGEWFFNTTTKRMRIYSTTNPGSTVRASWLDTVIVLGSRSYITIDNLSVEGAGLYGVSGNVSTTGNLIIKNCTFNNNTRAINLWNCFASTISNNTISNSFNVGILYFNRQQKQQNIDSNNVYNTGIIAGNGIFASNENLCGIVQETDSTRANNFANIRRNVVRNVGYMAIKFQGSNIRVSKNVVDSFCLNIDDGGGIYTFLYNDSTVAWNYFNRIIDSNFISNCIGAPLGTNRSTPDAIGLYIDDQANVINGYHNSVWNIPGYGVQLNNPRSVVLYDNTVYNSSWTLNIKHKLYGPVINNRVTRNILYQKLNTQFNFQHESSNLSQPPPPQTIIQRMQNIAYIDSNWITNLKTAGYDYYYSTTGSGFTFPSPITLASWRTNILHDIASALPPTVVTNTNTNFYANKTDTTRVLDLTGYSKVDPKGNVFNNLATVPPWSSLILIDNGTATPINQFPIANAGTDQTITQPSNSATLNGSASSDPDGTIILYEWSQLSGPSASTIASPNTAITPVNDLIAGIYQYQLRVTDNSSATSVAVTRVTVNVPPNTPPVANAGEDQNKVLPVSTATLTGSGTDPDGTITAYLWEKISGPSGGTITTPASATTGVTGLQQGMYAFQLSVTDNGGLIGSDIMNIVVNPENLAPVASAGDDQTTTLPDNSVTLTGTATDQDGTITSYSWTKISGPTGGTIVSPTDTTTDISDLTEGTFVFQFTATDNNGAVGSDFVQVVVYPEIPPVNSPPIAYAGADTTIILPSTLAALNGVGIDTNGVISAYFWTQISGPTATILTPTTASTNVTLTIAGNYIFQLRVTDNLGDTATDAIQVTLNAANLLPIVSAGSNQIITLPQDSTTITATATDPDGDIVSTVWVKVDGPSGGDIGTPNELTTTIENMVEGVYIYRIKATDNNGDTAISSVQITVNPVPIITAPTANAGTGQVIQLPDTDATLSGSGINGTGTIISHVWEKFSGPSGGDIATPNNYTTTITNLQEGLYIYKLTVTDSNGLIGTDLVPIAVRPVPPLVLILLRGYKQ